METWLRVAQRKGQLLVDRHARLLTLLVGSLVVSAWTVIRHITNGVNFDVVGQIGLADQWAHGMHSGAQVGSTNYLLKMPFYIIVNGLHFLSPHAKLLALALLFNLATFILLFILFEKILQLLGVTSRRWLYLSFLWLATISGRVYWLDYANSRNLETVGGILLVYLALRLIHTPSARTAAWLGLVGTVVLFADPLQFFVIGLPICLYVFVRFLTHRTRSSLLMAAYTALPVGVAFLGSWLLFWLSTAILPVSYLAIPNHLLTFSASNIASSIKATSLSSLSIFDAYFFKQPYGVNSLREFLNVIVLVWIVVLGVRLVLKRGVGYTRGLLLTIILINYVVYLGSGQALQWETSRYLVMVPLICLLLVSIWAEELTPIRKRLGQTLWLGIVVVSMLLIVGALVRAWPERYSKDYYISAAALFMEQGHYRYGVSSRAVGIPTSYFAFGQVTILPTLCSADQTVHFNNLFFDKAPLALLSHESGEIPIILQPEGIRNGGLQCTKQDIITQFGQPEQELNVPGLGVAEIYPANQVRLTE